MVHEGEKLTAEAAIEENGAQSSRFNEESYDEMLDPYIEILKFKTVEFELVQNENNEIVGLETREFDDSDEVQNVAPSFHRPNIQMIVENRLEAESKTKAEERIRLKAELEKKARLDAESKAKAEKKEQARLEDEAKVKAEAEEQARLEAEAKTYAEEKVRFEAEATEKARLEAKAKAKAEEQTRLKAEAKAELEEEANLEVRGFLREKARLEAEAEVKSKEEEKAKLKTEEQSRLEAESIDLLSKFKCSHCTAGYSSESDLNHHMALPPCVYLQDEAGPVGSLFGIIEDESVSIGCFE